MIIDHKQITTKRHTQATSVQPRLISSSEEFNKKSSQHQEYLFHSQRVERILDRINVYRNSRFEPFYEGSPRSVILWPDEREMDVTFTDHLTSDVDITLLGFSSLQQFYTLSASKRDAFLTEAQNLHQIIFSCFYVDNYEKNFLKQAYRFYSEIHTLSHKY